MNRIPSVIRNVNLEEIETDALFGIEQLKYQTLFQKIIFFGCIIAGVLENIIIPFVFPQVPTIVRIVIFIVLTVIGVLFGANFNQDMSLIKYLIYFFSRTENYLESVSSESVEMIRKAEKERTNVHEKEREVKEYDRAESLRLLKMLVVLGVIILAAVIAVFIVFSLLNETSSMHHTV